MENDIRVQVKKAGLTAGMDLPDGSKLLSRIIDIIKDKSGNFLKPVTITLSFNNSGLNPDKYDIAIYYYDENTGKWIALDNTRLNLEAGTISGDTNHFTKFAVIATPKVIKEEKPAKPVTPQPVKNIPSDISGHWAKDSISTAAAHGIISGYDENTFGPDNLITREQAAVIIARAAQLKAITGELNFTDSKAISPWAKPGVAAACKDGFISGYPDGSFRPQGNTTRAEAAVIIGKLWK